MTVELTPAEKAIRDSNAEISQIYAKKNAATTATTEAAATPAWWSTSNAMTISVSVLVFGVFVLALMTFLLSRNKRAGPDLRLLGTMVVIIMTVFLVVAGYDDKQLSAPIGLLGTIVGYLLGRDSADKTPQSAPPTGGPAPAPSPGI